MTKPTVCKILRYIPTIYSQVSIIAKKNPPNISPKMDPLPKTDIKAQYHTIRK